MANLYKVPRFTKQASIFLNGLEFSEEDWLLENIPDNFFEFGYLAFREISEHDKDMKKDDVMLICTIGEDFIRYAINNNEKDTDQLLSDYINQMTPETALDLLQEEDFDAENYLMGLPLVIDRSPEAFDDISFQETLNDDEMCNQITKILSMAGEADVMFPGTLVSETSLFSYDRHKWINHVADEKMVALERRSFVEMSSMGASKILAYMPFLAKRYATSPFIPVVTYAHIQNYFSSHYRNFHETEPARRIEMLIEEELDDCSVYIPDDPVYSSLCLEQSREIKKKMADERAFSESVAFKGLLN